MKEQREKKVWCCQKTKNRRPVREQVSVASLVAYIRTRTRMRTRTLEGPRRNMEGSTPRRKTINPFFAFHRPSTFLSGPSTLPRSRLHGPSTRFRVASAFWETGSSAVVYVIENQYPNMIPLNLSFSLFLFFKYTYVHLLSFNRSLAFQTERI